MAINEIVVNQNSVLISLIAVIQTLKYIDILDITSFEDEYIEKSMVEPSVYNDLIINPISLCKRKRREKFKLALQNGVPIPNSYLFTYHFRNNKNSIWLYFKLYEDNTIDKTTCIPNCTNMIPKIVIRF